MLIVFILLMTIEHRGAGLGFVHASYYDDYETDVCDVTSLSGDMSYVTAYYRPINVCNSTSPSRDIHVINVRVTSSHTDDVDERRRSRRRQTVELNIVPAENDTTVYGGRDLVFVIGSIVPIVWHINTQHIAPTVQIHFWVLNNESRILRQNRPNMKIKRFTLQSLDTQSIVVWTSRHLGSVTSTTEPLLSSAITHTLPHSGAGCDRANDSELVVQPIEGCVARWNEGAHGKDVHIIEVHSAVDRSLSMSTSNGATPTIELFAHSNRKTMSRRQHFVLVLRAHVPVLWKLRTKGLRGTLDLITDYTVDTNGVDMNLVRVVTERLGSLSSSALVAWTADKYGLAVSYTNVQTANYLELTVDGVKQTKKSAKNSEPTVDEVDRTKDWTDDAIRAVEFIRSSLLRSRSLVCHSDGFILSLRKNILKTHGVNRDQLSLTDRTCQPRENATHYVWKSKFSHCATQLRRYQDKMTYQNAILISWPHSVQDDYSEDEDEVEEGPSEYSGSGQSQGQGQGQAVVADVDTEQDYTRTFGINFSCDYSHRNRLATATQNVEYHLKLYSDDNYQREIGIFPQDLDEHRTVYVEAGITADVTKQVMIQNCSLIPAESWQTRHHPLIVKGCVLDKTVKWLHEDPNDVSQSQRFEFVLQKYWEGERELMLQCELTVCSRTLHSANDIPLCVTKTRFCLESNIQHPSLPRRHVPNIVVSRGPLMLRLAKSLQATASPGVTGSSGGLLDESATKLSSASESDRCSSAIHVDGLETTAVICIAFAAFVIGILLAGALWYIHSHTGSPQKARQCGQHSLDTSGESTPCSNAPIAVHQVHRHV